LPPNVEANEECMQTVTAKSMRYPSSKKIRWGYIHLLPAASYRFKVVFG